MFRFLAMENSLCVIDFDDLEVPSAGLSTMDTMRPTSTEPTTMKNHPHDK